METIRFQPRSIEYAAAHSSAGATVHFVTRSGTNRLAGSAYEFFGDEALNSNTAIDERLGRPEPSYDSNQFGVPVTLDTDVYNGANITDEQLTLDIVDFRAQVLKPQITAVAEGIEEAIAAQIVGGG